MNKKLYQVIYEELLTKIKNFEYKEGSKLPSESELCHLHNVSRITAKRALNELEARGYIRRIKGKGNFVLYTATPAKHSHDQVLFVMPTALYFSDPKVAEIATGITEYLSDKKISLAMVSTDFLNNQTAASLMRSYLGIIYYVENTIDWLDLFHQFERQSYPLVFLDKTFSQFSSPTIVSDNRKGGLIATNYLLKLQHEKIAYLFEKHQIPETTKNRYLGYLDALNEKQISFHSRSGELSLNENTTEDIVNFLEKNNITAVFCENDSTAIRFIQLLEAASHSSSEYAIMGFDNTYSSTLITPSLTTIAQNFYQIGSEAGKSIYSQISSKNEIEKSVIIPVSLIKRNSTFYSNKK